MPAETRVITTEQMARVREIDFTRIFGENVNDLLEMLNVTRKIPVTAGTTLKVLSVTGTLQSGKVDEGDIIPLSQYQTTWTPIGEVELLKWRKATTAEAIIKGGYDQAVTDTDAKLLKDVQKSVRSKFITSLAGGGSTASGASLQPALADAWGKLQVLFEDDDIQAVYFLNPQDVAAYLGSATVTTQTAFGFTYLKDFLGLGNVILSASVPQGEFYATASQNIVVYYLDVNGANGIGEAFSFTTDATGLIGIHEDANYQRMQEETVVVGSIDIFAEMPSGVVVGSINP